MFQLLKGKRRIRLRRNSKNRFIHKSSIAVGKTMRNGLVKFEYEKKKALSSVIDVKMLTDGIPSLPFHSLCSSSKIEIFKNQQTKLKLLRTGSAMSGSNLVSRRVRLIVPKRRSEIKQNVIEILLDPFLEYLYKSVSPLLCETNNSPPKNDWTRSKFDCESH